MALSRGARAILDRSLSERETSLFNNYMILLNKWQRTQRLAGSSESGWVVKTLFLDSLLFLHVLPPSLTSLLDLGSGAGIPGIPIKIVVPEVKLLLVESRRRRASFLSTVVRELSLVETRVVVARAEDLVDEVAGRVDAVVMRCAGNTETLLPIAARLVSPGGVVVASGPPRPKAAPIGEWITVDDRAHGGTRAFLVYRRAVDGQ